MHILLMYERSGFVFYKIHIHQLLNNDDNSSVISMCILLLYTIFFMSCF